MYKRQDFEYSFKRLACPDTAAPYAETVVGMIDGYEDAIGNPDADGNTTTDPDWDVLNVHASEDGKTLTVQLAYPCSYFEMCIRDSRCRAPTSSSFWTTGGCMPWARMTSCWQKIRSIRKFTIPR